jgi:hypothetical protein
VSALHLSTVYAHSRAAPEPAATEPVVVTEPVVAITPAPTETVVAPPEPTPGEQLMAITCAIIQSTV